jgi:myo-inositol-1(or 4)-monophosphatase
LPDADRAPPLSEVAAILVDAVQAAGAVALKMFRGPIRQWLKEAGSPVCEADIAVDALLRERLVAGASSFGWLSEETEADPARLEAERIWIVDPIDGTRSYLAGRSDWSVSVALVDAGRPVLAALFAPVTEELFLAVHGQGATRNGSPIAARSGSDLAGVRIAGPKRYGTWLSRIEGDVVEVPRIGSLALRLARVAQGELDLTFAGGRSHDWDLAAADLLVHEAGGAMTTLLGEVVTYNQAELTHGALIAAGRERHARLIELMRGRLAELA